MARRDPTEFTQRLEPVCPSCLIYEREQRLDGYNDYSVCTRCGRSDLKFMAVSVPKLRVVYGLNADLGGGG
jgi:hypothetical protein